ncbi:MAG: translation elongation factor Ts, partial [Alphaproteobacteria bacterium]|nr:translation elongation factor Ts [Alphaproteobacteria bacterium]
CKRALGETEGDIEQAVDWLRKKGLAAAAKKSGRVAAEGLVALVTDGNAGALVEINSETDFVARNEDFQGFARTVAGLALVNDGDRDRIVAADYPDAGRGVADELTAMIGRIGENMVFRRSGALRVETGVVAGYVHNAAAPGLGKIGVLVGLQSAADQAELAAFGRKLAMHVCAARPEAVSRAEIDPAALDRERSILADQARASGKPEEIVEKMVEGRLRKYYEEVVLVDQTYVITGEGTVGAAIEQAAKDLGQPITVTGFVCFVLGEGVEREETDFAAEVAAQIGN